MECSCGYTSTRKWTCIDGPRPFARTLLKLPCLKQQRTGRCRVVPESVRVEDVLSTTDIVERKRLSTVGKDLLSDIIATITGKEDTMYFSDDRKLLQAHEVKELWNICLNRTCTVSQIATALDNSFNIEIAFAKLPDKTWKLVGLARTVSDGAFAALLVDVCVHPDYRRQGIGSQMLMRLESASKKSGAGTLGVFAHPREFMFLWKCGFRYYRKYAVMQYVGPLKEPSKTKYPNQRALENTIARNGGRHV